MRVQSLRALQPNRVKYSAGDWYLLATSALKQSKLAQTGAGNATILAGSNVVTLATYVPHVSFEVNREIQVNGEVNYIDSVTSNTFVCRNNFTTNFTGAWAYTVVNAQADQSSTKSISTVGAGFDPHLIKEPDGSWGHQYTGLSTTAYKQLFFTTSTNNSWNNGARNGFLCTFKITNNALGGNSPERLIYYIRNTNDKLEVDSSNILRVTIANTSYNLGAVTVGVKYTIGWYTVLSGNADARIIAINTSGQLVTLSSTGHATALTNEFIYIGACLFDFAGFRRRPMQGIIYNMAVSKATLTNLEFFQIAKHLRLKGTL